VIRVATSDEMRRADRRVTERHGVPSLLLMENAGRSAADVIERVLGPVVGRQVAVVAGKGQNGGDGFVVARQLATRGAGVSVWLAAPRGEVAGDAATNLAALERSGLGPVEVTDGPALERLRVALRRADLVVDALLGTGVRGPATGAVADVIVAVNDAGRPVCALDLPSGLSAEDGAILGQTVRATLTVTLGLPKIGLYLPAGTAHAGRVELADLGVPRAWLEEGLAMGLLEASDVAPALPPRPVDSHKGRFGHLLVVAGSLGKTGAAVLACRGALRVGTGLVTCAAALSQQPIVAAHLVEGMTEALPETGAQSLSVKARERILELAGHMSALALGPGLGLDPETQELVRALARDVDRPMVLDADALTALVGALESLRHARGARLLTPHPGEAARLLGLTVADVQRDRVGAARRLASESGTIVALKGAYTVIASPGAEAVLNPTGNPAMATGGTGDVLTGVAGGLLAQGVPAESALRAAVYLHGLAGDLAAAGRGAGLVAGDLAECLPAAIARVQTGGGTGA
jgi:ADP-dependent NAD(P)H-hydrate dehydratase / NAD(P)H-hydrate epimerase